MMLIQFLTRALNLGLKAAWRIHTWNAGPDPDGYLMEVKLIYVNFITWTEKPKPCQIF